MKIFWGFKSFQIDTKLEARKGRCKRIKKGDKHYNKNNQIKFLSFL